MSPCAPARTKSARLGTGLARDRVGAQAPQIVPAGDRSAKLPQLTSSAAGPELAQGGRLAGEGPGSAGRGLGQRQNQTPVAPRARSWILQRRAPVHRDYPESPSVGTHGQGQPSRGSDREVVQSLVRSLYREATVESPVRLRAAATFPGAPPHLWILLTCTTLPFAGSELSFPGGPWVHAGYRLGELGAPGLS